MLTFIMPYKNTAHKLISICMASSLGIHHRLYFVCMHGIAKNRGMGMSAVHQQYQYVIGYNNISTRASCNSYDMHVYPFFLEIQVLFLRGGIRKQSYDMSSFKTMSGWLQLKTGHKWVGYEFKTSGVYLHYFASGKEKVRNNR